MAHKRVLYTGPPQTFLRLGVTLEPGEQHVEESALAVLLANPDVQGDLAVLDDDTQDGNAATAAEEA